MKLLVFAHTPPPHHGQSYMVDLMLEHFGGDHRRATSTATATPYGITCYHVNARLSRDLEDIGGLRPAKLALLLKYCLEAIWCRLRYGVTTLYYVPAPGKRVALVRDWIVLLLCRPFFRRVVLHWHAAGLAKWLETVPRLRTRSITYRLFKDIDLSIVLSNYNRPDATKFWPKRVAVVGNGIPDPCAEFDGEVLPRRRARLGARAKLLSGQRLTDAEQASAGGAPEVFNVLFLATCTREKGLFDTLDAVALANRRLAAENRPVRMHLRVAGAFLTAEERRAFEDRISRDDLQTFPDDVRAGAARRPAVTYAGFVRGRDKHRLFVESDCFCFPTYFYAESFGLVVAEATAYGLPVVTTRWRSMPELLPPGYPGLVAVRRPDQVAQTLQDLLTFDACFLRRHFLSHFTAEQCLTAIAAALHGVETRPGTPHPDPAF